MDKVRKFFSWLDDEAQEAPWYIVAAVSFALGAFIL